MNRLQSKKLFLLDMDGTIYIDNKLFDGTLDFLEQVEKNGGRAMYLTNNSSRSVDGYLEKLHAIGITNSKREDFLTSAQVAATHLLKNHRHEKIYVFGTRALKSELAGAGLDITDKIEDNISCLCMGYDTELTFQKLEDACILLGRGVSYVATNPDLSCPTYYGFAPDCGSISQILCNATGRMPLFIGKPQPEMIYAAIETSGFSKEDTVMIGDRMYTDIASGYNAGIDTILVLSGEATADDAEKSDFKPTFILKDIKEVYNIIKG